MGKPDDHLGSAAKESTDQTGVPMSGEENEIRVTFSRRGHNPGSRAADSDSHLHRDLRSQMLFRQLRQIFLPMRVQFPFELTIGPGVDYRAQPCASDDINQNQPGFESQS